MCGGCQRHHAKCIYGRAATTRVSERLANINIRASNVKTNAKTKNTASADGLGQDLEARKERILELKLLHHYTIKTSWSISLQSPGSTEEMMKGRWATAIPRIAFDHDSLLHAIYCISAMHIATVEPDNMEAIEAYSRYLDLALQEHRKEVFSLSKDNADAACLTSTIIRITAFVILQARGLRPYTPPTHWLSMTRESAMVFKSCWTFIGDEPNSMARAIVTGTPSLTDNGAVFQDNGPKPWDLKEQFGESNRKDLLHLLERRQADEYNEPWDEETQKAYQSTLSYIGSVQIAIAAREASWVVLRRLIAFPMLIQKPFIELVARRQPRALVVLAHYFAYLVRFRDIWWIGDTGRREILGIQTILPDEWQYLLDWPLQAMEAESLV